MTILLSLVGGLFTAFKIISSFIVSIIFRERSRQNEGNNRIIRCQLLFAYLRSLPFQIQKILMTLKLYKEHGQSENEQRIHIQRQSTRLYLFLLILILIILAIYQTISINMFTKTITNPSSIIFKHLYAEHSDMLICSCSQISMN